MLSNQDAIVKIKSIKNQQNSGKFCEKNLENLINNSRDSSFPIKISLVISNNKNANGIKFAKKHKIPYVFINTNIKNHEIHNYSMWNSWEIC